MSRLIKRIKKSTQINRVRNEEGSITVKTKKIQNIVRDYFKNLFSFNLENIKEMKEFLDSAKPPNLNQEVNNLKRPIQERKVE